MTQPSPTARVARTPPVPPARRRRRRPCIAPAASKAVRDAARARPSPRSAPAITAGEPRRRTRLDPPFHLVQRRPRSRDARRPPRSSAFLSMLAVRRATSPPRRRTRPSARCSSCIATCSASSSQGSTNTDARQAAAAPPAGPLRRARCSAILRPSARAGCSPDGLRSCTAPASGCSNARACASRTSTSTAARSPSATARAARTASPSCPRASRSALRAHLDKVRRVHAGRSRRRRRQRRACPTRSPASTPTPPASGPGSGSFPRRGSTSTADTGERRRHHLHESVLQRAFRDAVRAAGITKPATCHTLAAFVRHPPAGERLRHPDHPGAARPQRRRRRR